MKIVEDYLDEVCSYVKKGPFRRTIRRELGTYMEDCMSDRMSQGMNEKEAAEYAISQMGDAKRTGESLNEQYVVRPNYKIIFCVLGMFFLHLMMKCPFDFSWTDISFVILSVIGGTGLFWLLSKIDSEKYFFIIKYIYLHLLF